MKIDELFDKCKKITLSKRHDYTSSADNHENFKRSAELASWFRDDSDKAYVILIGTKLARLASLLTEDKKPNHESIEDTFIDLVNYCGLWAERRLDNQVKLEEEKYPYCLYCASLPNPNEIRYYNKDGKWVHFLCFGTLSGESKAQFSIQRA